MVKKIYTLLVGINEYKNTYKNATLSGCVNDIEVIQTYSSKRIDIDKQWELVEKKLINESATRQNIIDAFQQHLCQAGEEDVVLFYYAGHGSYEPAPNIFRTLNQDRQLETIVCYDSQTEGVLDLADKELNYLIEQVAQKNPHILVILDCCHSGTATREPNVVERQAPTTGVARNLQDFLFPEAWINKRLSDNYKIPRHIAIAACREHQKAKEYVGNYQVRGAFSYFLTEALHRATSLSYVDLVREINALITGKVDNQSPQIEGGAEDCRLTFLGGAIGERTNYLNLYYDEQTHHSWMIDSGILHGIRPVSEGDTILAIFPKDLAPEELLQTTNAVCKAQISQVMTECSKVELLDYSSNLSKQKAYCAVIVEVPLPKLKVYFTGDEKGIQFAATALHNSIFIQEVESCEQANYYLEATNNQYWIKVAVDKRPLVAPIPEEPATSGYTSQDANQIIKRLENIARWQNILDLKTPATSQIQPGDIEMEIIITSGSNRYSSKEITSDMRGEYTLKSDGTAEPPRVEVKIVNNTDKTLYFHIIELAESYGICVPNFFEEKSSIRLSAREIISSTKPIKFGIPSEYVKSGVTEYDGIFKLIASTREFNATLLEQKGVSSPPPQHRSSGVSGTLNRLMNKVYTREPLGDDDEYIDNWMTQEVKVTYIKPPSGVEIQQSEAITIINGVQLQSHSTFKGRFSLKPLPPTSRSSDSKIVPPTFIESINLFKFNRTTRDGSGISSVLEITNVENHETVTPGNPLKIVVQNREGLLNSDEHLLITAFDGEFFLPIGKGKTEGQCTEITIERLPVPTVSGRSLHGSIIILFQKLIYKTLGTEFTYPLLRSVEVSQDKQRAVYEQDKEKIKSSVTSSEKILLYIHGIIGDTTSLVKSLQLAKFTENGQEKTLRDKYNLVLAFDYENLHTTIEDNAKFLKQRLEEIGLGANHGKQLHIVAHSMGGLISRTFIEKEGGNQVVQHLVMLGTPNNGSPWPCIQDWAFMCLGIGLNQLSTIIWPANILAALLAFLEVNDNALEQMNPKHSFITDIATNPDPNVQYTIIAGDCSIKKQAYSTELGKQSAIIRLSQKLFSSTTNNMLDTICNLVFNEPNDIAVALDSIKSINLNRNPQPRIISPDAACDHLTYFSSQAGLDALIKALI